MEVGVEDFNLYGLLIHKRDYERVKLPDETHFFSTIEYAEQFSVLLQEKCVCFKQAEMEEVVKCIREKMRIVKKCQFTRICPNTTQEKKGSPLDITSSPKGPSTSKFNNKNNKNSNIKHTHTENNSDLSDVDTSDDDDEEGYNSSNNNHDNSNHNDDGNHENVNNNELPSVQNGMIDVLSMQPEAYQTIKNFNFEMRGLILTYIHVLNETMNVLEMKKLNMKKVEYMISKLKTLLVLFKFATIIAEKKEKDKTIFPFCDGIDIEQFVDYKLMDTKPFLQDVGTQFHTEYRYGLALLVKVTASYGQTSTSWQGYHPIVQSLDFVKNNLYYLLDSKQAAEDCHSFFNIVTPERGKGLWGLPDEGIFKFMNFNILPHVEVSHSFKISSFNLSLNHENSPSSTVYYRSEKDEHNVHVNQDLDVNSISMKENESTSPTVSSSMDIDTSVITNQISGTSTIGHPQNIAEENSGEKDISSISVLIERDTNYSTITTKAEIDNEINHSFNNDLVTNAEKNNVSPKLNETFQNIDLTRTEEVATEMSSQDIDSTDESNTSVPYELFQQKLKEIPSLLSDYKGPSTTQLRIISQYEPNELDSASDFPVFDDARKFFTRMVSNVKPASIESEGVIIFHIHGGGFVAMTSFSHECYLRRWAVDTNVPIISCDYQLAPDAKYPVQLEECYHAYQWTIKNARRFLRGKSLRKVIIAGDSAGGNLSLGVTIRAIETGFRVPDALVLTYPATFLVKVPSYARLLAPIDPLVNDKFLTMCSSSYFSPGNDSRHNPFISPAITPDEILAKLPPTLINVGTLDPLFDDAIFLAKRISSLNGGKVKLEVYDGMGHGYLNMAFDVLFPQSVMAVKNISDWINQFLIESHRKEQNPHS